MADNTNALIPRDSLARFLPDNDTIRRFEKLFQAVNVTVPINLEIIFSRLDELLEGVGSAESRSNFAADLSAALRAEMGDLLGLLQEPSVTPSESSEDLRGLMLSPESVQPRAITADYLDFDQFCTEAPQVGRAAWNATDDTLNIHHSGGVTQQVGLESYARITNNAGFTIPNGSAVGFDPVADSFVLFIADGTLPPLTIIGIATQEILDGAQGRITNWGRVRNLDTTGTPVGEVWAAGDILYTSTTIAGALTNMKPTAPNVSLPIAQVRVVSSTIGQIFVRPTIEQQLYYGQFDKTTDQVPTAANTANAITWSSALIASGVSIGTPTSRIVVANAGLYSFSASFQLTSGSASVKNVWLWFRKNGTDIPNSALITSMDSGTAIRAPSRTLLISLAAGDYVELMWAADDTNVTLDAIAATAFSPGAPAALLTVNQEQQ